MTPAKNGRLKNNFFGALWTYDTNEIVPAGSDDALQSEWQWAAINNDGDFLLERPSVGRLDTLWHQQWSAANGPRAIADLIDPDDPNRELFDYAYEITDHGANDWPTIIADGTETVDGVEQDIILILDPVLNANP